jgi:hypothetical protein
MVLASPLLAARANPERGVPDLMRSLAREVSIADLGIPGSPVRHASECIGSLRRGPVAARILSGVKIVRARQVRRTAGGAGGSSDSQSPGR